jgi:hypothetical protein
MNYRIVWHLVGQEGRFLDQGRLDDDYEDYGEAALAISQWLSGYAEASHSEDGSHWRARRSPDADLELRIWISRDDCGSEARPATADRVPH